MSASLELLLKKLRLPSIAGCHTETAITAEKNSWSFGQYLHELAKVEVNDRRLRRIERYLKKSGLPQDKTLGTLDDKCLPVKVRRKISSLCEGAFLKDGENILAFGNPGTGKSHLLAAVGHERWRSSSRSSRNVTSVAASRSVAIWCSRNGTRSSKTK